MSISNTANNLSITDSNIYANIASSYFNNTGNGKLTIDSNLNVHGDIFINGQSLNERLSVIEQTLNIPTRDVTMEQKYPKLKEIYEQYKHELEKYKTWERIKDKE